jgi:hypothetical protein
VRDLLHATDPEVQETIKRRVRTYFVLEGNICALLATKDGGDVRPHHRQQSRRRLAQTQDRPMAADATTSTTGRAFAQSPGVRPR